MRGSFFIQKRKVMFTHKRLITLPWANYYPAKPTPNKPRHGIFPLSMRLRLTASRLLRLFVFSKESEWTDSIAGLL